MSSEHAPAASRRCPVCGESRRKKLFRQTFEQMSSATLMGGYDVVICDGCGAAFADGVPKQAAFDAYYREMSKYENTQRGGRESEFDEQRFREVALEVAKWIPSQNARILEIGCATGRQLDLIRAAGYPNVEGLDPSPGCADAAWELYRVPVMTKTIFDVDGLAGRYDFLVLSHVLEHIEDLDRALGSVSAALAPGGRIYAEVPDATRMAGRSDAPYQEFSTEHINFLAPQSLTNLFAAHGLSPLIVQRAVRQQNHNTTCPVAWGIFAMAAASPARVRDEETGPALARYVEECGGEDARIRSRIREGSKGRPIIVWGTGTHTQRLLATGAFEGIEIAAFVDSNPKYQAQTLHGRPVLAPDAIASRQEPVLVSSHGFQQEISDQIRKAMALPNELILLYDE